MKRIAFVLLTLCTLSSPSIKAQRNATYDAYIKQYAPLAIEEQRKHHIPASITLAQCLLESGAGQSELAHRSNNHFGIKCGSTWNGHRVRYDDDKRHECFRKYSRVGDSYNDHSLFLKKERYEKLFKLKITDYKGWAHGLKKAGYATDPRYAYKLIEIIETYELYQYDKGSTKTSKSGWTFGRKNKKSSQTASPPPSPASTTPSIQAAQTSAMGTILAYNTHKVERHNGVKYVRAASGDTYTSIAKEFGLSVREILVFNDLHAEKPLTAGERVYIRQKKNRARTALHTVRVGETAHSIAQYYGIRMSALYDLNQMSYTESVKINQQLRLK